MIAPFGIGMVIMLGFHAYTSRKIDRLYNEQNKRIDMLTVRVDTLITDVERILTRLR